MSTTHEVDFGGVHVRGAWASPAAEVQAELAVYTKTGQARIAVLDERDLIRLIGEASTALGQLLTHRTATVDDTRLVRPTERLDTSARGMLDVEGPGGAQVLPR